MFRNLELFNASTLSPFTADRDSFSLVTGDLYGNEFSSALLAQDMSSTYAKILPGAYLSWIKLLLIAVVFVLWVRMADWINRDSMKLGEYTDLLPEVWNPINLGVFALGLLAVLFVPVFFAGLPVYLICAWLPFLLYFFMRRSKVKADPRILEIKKLKTGEAPPIEVLPQDEGAQVEFAPAGNTDKERQVNLIRARQSAGFAGLKDLITEALFKRADLILLDYGRDRVNCRIQVDGVWHALPPMDRETGDAILVSLKSLAGLNPAERRAQQSGTFSLKTETEKADVDLVCQGVKTGERAQVKFRRKKKAMMTLGQLGMFPEMVAKVKQSMDQPGFCIISAPPGSGLTSSWQGALCTADRMTRDCVGLIEEGETETAAVENIVIHRFDSKQGKLQFDVAKGMLLSQPDFLAVPKVETKEAMDLLVNQVTSHDRSLILRTNANSAAEALLKLYAQSGDRQQFANAINCVTAQRLVRRLCDGCKQEVRVSPKMIHQLGGDPKQQSTLFNQFKLPPPEQRVDEKGRPIEFPPCELCGGIGFIGRIGVFELLEVNETVRVTLLQNPKVEALEQAAAKTGKKPMVNSAYRLVLLGITSLGEVQRVFKS